MRSHHQYISPHSWSHLFTGNTFMLKCWKLNHLKQLEPSNSAAVISPDWMGSDRRNFKSTPADKKHKPTKRIKRANISNLRFSNGRVEIFRGWRSDSRLSTSLPTIHTSTDWSDLQYESFVTGFVSCLTFLDLLLFVAITGTQESKDNASLRVEADSGHDHPAWSLHHMGSWGEIWEGTSHRQKLDLHHCHLTHDWLELSFDLWLSSK